MASAYQAASSSPARFPRYPSFRRKSLDSGAVAFPSGLPPASVGSDYYATFCRRTGKDLYDGVPLCGSW
jgi:hypothetical protein